MTNEEVKSIPYLAGYPPVAGPRELHINTIRLLGACENGRVSFRKAWGESVMVTPDEMAKQAETFPWDWCFERLLSRVTCGSIQDELAEAAEDYRRKDDLLTEERDRNCGQRYNSHGDRTAKNQAAFDKYREERSKINAVWEEKRARAFARAYLADAKFDPVAYQWGEELNEYIRRKRIKEHRAEEYRILAEEAAEEKIKLESRETVAEIESKVINHGD